MTLLAIYLYLAGTAAIYLLQPPRNLDGALSVLLWPIAVPVTLVREFFL